MLVACSSVTGCWQAGHIVPAICFHRATSAAALRLLAASASCSACIRAASPLMRSRSSAIIWFDSVTCASNLACADAAVVCRLVAAAAAASAFWLSATASSSSARAASKSACTCSACMASSATATRTSSMRRAYPDTAPFHCSSAKSRSMIMAARSSLAFWHASFKVPMSSRSSIMRRRSASDASGNPITSDSTITERRNVKLDIPSHLVSMAWLSLVLPRDRSFPSGPRMVRPSA